MKRYVLPFLLIISCLLSGMHSTAEIKVEGDANSSYNEFVEMIHTCNLVYDDMPLSDFLQLLKEREIAVNLHLTYSADYGSGCVMLDWSQFIRLMIFVSSDVEAMESEKQAYFEVTSLLSELDIISLPDVYITRIMLTTNEMSEYLKIELQANPETLFENFEFSIIESPFK